MSKGGIVTADKSEVLQGTLDLIILSLLSVGISNEKFG